MSNKKTKRHTNCFDCNFEVTFAKYIDQNYDILGLTINKNYENVILSVDNSDCKYSNKLKKSDIHIKYEGSYIKTIKAFGNKSNLILKICYKDSDNVKHNEQYTTKGITIARYLIHENDKEYEDVLISFDDIDIVIKKNSFIKLHIASEE